MIQIGVIGYGPRGQQLVRSFTAVPQANVVAICDRRREQVAEARGHWPQLCTTTEAEDLFDEAAIHAVAIATPVANHFELARRALRAGKHVWVEKPMTSTSEQAAILVEEARRAGRVLHVDHTDIYTPAVQKVHELLAENKLGELYYYDSIRVNLGLFQHDVNVVWDLGVDDLAIIDYLFADRPVAVSATGIAHVADQMENVAYVTLFFPCRQIAHLHVNWLAPVKLRQALIGGSEKTVLWDELQPSEKIKVYDNGIMASQTEESRWQKLTGYRTGDVWSPQLDRTEALLVEVRHFLDCLRQGRSSLSDGEGGLRIVRTLEAVTASMRRGGEQIALS